MSGLILIIFVILLIAFILCTFLGVKEGFESNTNTDGQITSITTNNGNTYTLEKDTDTDTDTNTNTNTDGTKDTSTPSYDNYNHYSGASHPVMFYGPDGGTARVIQIGNDDTLVITYKNGTTDIYYIDNDTSSDTTVKSAQVKQYYGPNGASAKIITTSNGKQAVEITTMSGTKIVYTEDNPYASTSQDPSMNADDSYDMNQNYAPNETTMLASNSYKNQYYNNSASSSTSTDYSASLPPGIPKSMIPKGQEDLYILKSEVVPPVCPACPEPIVQCPDSFDPSKIPPCPPCARCPESPFECKKVPNYDSFNQDYLPVPVLNDFTTFGM